MKIFKLLILIQLTLLIALISKENYASILNKKVAVIHDNSKSLKIPDKLIYAIENNVSLTFCAHLNFAKKIGPFFYPIKTKMECSTVKRYAIGENFILNRDRLNKTFIHSDLKTIFLSMEQLEAFDSKDVSSGSSGNSYVLIRWFLDRKNLPSPLLLTTLFSKEWNFDTGWKVIGKL